MNESYVVSNNSQNLKRYVFLGGLLLSLLIALFIISSFSFIKIDVQNPDGQYTYTLINQAGQKSTKAESTTGSYKKLVRRGNYEVLVQKDDTSYFAVVKSGGFLLTKHVDAKLVAEKERVFVGDQPQPCMKMVGDKLVSYECGGQYDRLKLHNPSTRSQPTYTSNNPNGFTKNVIQILNVKGIDYAFMKLQETLGDPAYNLYQLGGAGDILNLPAAKIPLTNLSNSADYSAKPFDKGFIVYNDSFSEVYYYDSAGAQSTTIKVDAPKDSALKFYRLETNGSQLIVVYSNNADLEEAGPHTDEAGPLQAAGGTTTTEVVVYENGTTKRFTISKFITYASTCGTQKLCIRADDSAGIYDISGEKAKHLFDITELDLMATVNKTLVVGKKGMGVLAVDVDQSSGSLDYSYGDYAECGIEVTGTNYLLCVISNQHKLIALYIDRQSNNSNSIDKRVAELQRSATVSAISTYKNIVFVIPNYGSMIYKPSLGIYDYDPDTVKKINIELAQKLQASGIDQSKYTVVIASEQPR